MTGADLLLAAVLLSIPPGTPAGCPNPAEWPGLRDAVKQVAIERELLEPRETRYILTRAEDFCADLNMLRRRRADLSDAPHAAAAKRFPNKETVSDFIKFNRAYDKHICARMDAESDRAATLEVVRRENERLFKIYSAVRESQCGYQDVTVRRHALKKLRDLIGDEAFRSGELPPNVPTWRFAAVD